MEANGLRLYPPPPKLHPCIWMYMAHRTGRLLGQLLIMATLGLFLSMITAIGEEIGWRGFLLTELRATLSYKKINFAIGIIWYLYHMPLIIFSNYNNGNKFTSALCFFVMVMAMTIVANTLCMEANSM